MTDCSGGKQDGRTPTFAAVYTDHEECIEALARHGADVNIADKVLAALTGTWDHLADTCCRVQEGTTPLSFALRFRLTESIEVLRRHGARDARGTVERDLC